MANVGVTTENTCFGPVWNYSEYEVDVVLEKLGWSGSQLFFSIIFLPIVVVFGIGSNLSFIYVVWKIPSMRSIMNLYLVNLAFVDIGILFLNFFDYAFHISRTPLADSFILFGENGCFYKVASEICYFISLFTVTVVSLERYLAVCRPLQHMKMKGPNRIRGLLLFVWITGIIFGAFQMNKIGRKITFCLLLPDTPEFISYPKEFSYCDVFFPQLTPYTIIAQLLPFYLTLFSNIYLYWSIMQALLKRASHKGNNEESSMGEHAKKVKARNAAARMLVVNGCVFFFCNSPVQIYVTVGFFYRLFTGTPLHFWGGIQKTLNAIFNVLVYINSAVNPLIYGVTNVKYRAAFIRAFACKKGAKKRQSTMSNANSSGKTNSTRT